MHTHRCECVCVCSWFVKDVNQHFIVIASGEWNCDHGILAISFLGVPYKMLFNLIFLIEV